MSAPTTEAPPTGTRAGQLAGAAAWSVNYFDPQGRRHTARQKVPVNQYGQLAGEGFDCPKGCDTRWFAVNTGQKGEPVCPTHPKVKLRPTRLRRPPLLPWQELWTATERPLRAVWTVPALAAAGLMVDAGRVPALAVAGAVPLVGAGVYVAAARLPFARHWLCAESGLPGTVERAARSARLCGYGAAAATGWLTLAAALGVPAHSAGANTALWLSLLAVAALPVATWWRRLRNQRNRPEPEVVVEEPVEDVDCGEREVREIWATRLAHRQRQGVGVDGDGKPIVAQRAGKLTESWLEDWHRVSGGWAATAVGPAGVATAEWFAQARPAIASAFRMKASMVTVIPDADDETQALVLAQRQSPIAETVYWGGPKSVDGRKGVAEVARYMDGLPAMYEIYREGWGCPHDFLCGTTGAGKSEALSTLLMIDRWAHFVDAGGVAHGMVADVLIDPQQGQSYGPFVDDLAAPVATSLEEAMVVVEAFRQEMFRRNRYLANVTWLDPKRCNRDGSPVVRKSRKWWNPLIDGPLLTLNIDEAHEYLADKKFATLVTAGARMYRKCGMRVRVATHTPLLTDLGGSMALRSMLTGGFVWVGRTADALTGPVAFNGRLAVDPRSIPDLPGLGFVLSRLAPKPMLARVGWMEDYYDGIRDADDNPVGFPAALPDVTLRAFGAEFERWVAAMHSESGVWTPPAPSAEEPPVNPTSVDAVLAVLGDAAVPLCMDDLDAALRRAGTPFSTRTIRGALKKLDGKVAKRDNCWSLTDEERASGADELAVASEQATLFAAELADAEADL